jgi:hypothetical protein
MERHLAEKFPRRHNRKLYSFSIAVILILATLSFIPVPTNAASFTASLDRDSIALGESATLTLKFEGDLPQSEPSLPEIPGLNIGSALRNSIDLNINGVPSSILTLTYSLAPQHTGDFTIPALTADVNGQRLATAPLKLNVTQPQVPMAADIKSGSQIAFMKLTLPKTNIYTGEVMAADLRIYYRQDARLAQPPRLTDLPVAGFTVGKIASSDQSQVQIGNAIYNVIPAKIALTAIKSGPLSIGPIAVGLLLDVPSENQPRDPFFAQFGVHSPFFSGEQKQVALATERVNVESLPLPVENVPADFNGAVGNYSMTTTAGPTNLATGDPITVRVQISGRGALDAITLPNQAAWNDFKIFPPTSKVETTDQLGLEGDKTFEEIVTPQNTDIRALPPFSFSLFNPDDGKYHTLTQSAVPLAVHSGGATVMPAIAVNKNSAGENQTPQDILPIKENFGTLETKSVPLIVQPKFLAMQSLPVLAFLAAFIWRKRTDSLANNPRLRRQRAVAQLVRDGISDLKNFAVENKPEEFFATLFRLLQEQLGERLDCPASAITENVIDEHPVLRGAPKTTPDDLRELFQLCNQARYAPVRGSSELNSVAAQFEKTASELQNLKT